MNVVTFTMRAAAIVLLHHSAAAIVLLHHASGDSAPSPDDGQITD